MKEQELAIQIARCGELRVATTDSRHCCNSIVNEQSHVPDRHLPEPWFGNLSKARVLFISSNPSIDENHDDTGENFPRESWSDGDIAEWFTRRVDQSWDKVPVSFQHPDHKSFLWRCIDGQYRGAMPTGRAPQQTWNRTQGIARELLGDEADPSRNWALTEVVHCKSRDARGVSEAVTMRTSKWLNPILDLAEDASLLVLAGSKVRDGWARTGLGVSTEFGREVTGKDKKSQVKRALQNSLIWETGRRRRVVTYMKQPSMSNRFATWYGSEVTGLFGRIARGESEVPQSTTLLHSIIRETAGF